MLTVGTTAGGEASFSGLRGLCVFVVPKVVNHKKHITHGKMYRKMFLGDQCRQNLEDAIDGEVDDRIMFG